MKFPKLIQSPNCQTDINYHVLVDGVLATRDWLGQKKEGINMIPNDAGIKGLHSIGYYATQDTSDVEYREPKYMTINVGNACAYTTLKPTELHI
jgi:hypothetical protein